MSMNEIVGLEINGKVWDLGNGDCPLENNSIIFQYKGKLVEVFKSSLDCFIFKCETIIGKIEGVFRWVTDLIRSIILYIK